jgi:chromosome segregation ATPase
MMDALKEIQTRGDQMMNAINDQREVLINLTTEVDTAEGRLEKAIRTRGEMEIKWKIAEKKRLLAKENTRKIYTEKRYLENEILKLEKDKYIIKPDLRKHGA